MLRCPLCHRVFAAHKERCPRHSTLEPVEATRLDEALAARSTPLSIAELSSLIDAIVGLDEDGRLLLSLAVVAYELLAGTAPFEVEGRTVSQVVLERASGQYRPRTIASVVGEASKAHALDALFAEALAVEPERRPPSAQVFFSRMQGALAA